MPENWKTYKLGEVATIKYGKDHKKLEKGNYPCYGTGGIMRYVDTYLFDEESVLIPRKGSLNNIYYIDKPFWTVDTLFWTKINAELIFPKYFYYNLKTLDFASKDVGSAVPSLTTSLLNGIQIKIPEIAEQRAIASILSALDDKIELNLQTNRTLEDMAMTLYKHWFVDFGPFKNGEFVDSELGKIPKGWEVNNLENIVEVGSSKRIFLKEYVDVGIPFYRGKEVIQLSKGKNISTELFISKERFEEIKDKFGVPFKNDILVSSVGTIGVSWLVENNNPFYFKDGNLTWIKNYKEHVNGNFIFQWLKSDETQEQIKSETIGSTQQALTISALRKLKIVLPPVNSSIIQNVSTKLIRWNKLFISNKIETQTLTTLRDTLLPKLISGEVRVKEAEKLITRAL
jgi:type I restriction enzyme, S subunit